MMRNAASVNVLDVTPSSLGDISPEAKAQDQRLSMNEAMDAAGKLLIVAGAIFALLAIGNERKNRSKWD